MVNSEDVQETLVALQHGVVHKHHPNDQAEALLQCWGAVVGRVASTPVVLGSEAVLFETDISTIYFRGMGRIPVLLLAEGGNESARAIKKLSQHMSWNGVIGIVVSLNTEAETLVTTSSETPNERCVILSPDGLRELLTSLDPLSRLRSNIREQIPLDRLNPFNTCKATEGVTFVGRLKLLSKLVNSDQDFALCGLGGMGKTSLLRQLQWVLRRNRDPRYERIVEVDLNGCQPNLDAVCREIAKRIFPDKVAHSATLDDFETCLRWLKNRDARFRSGPIDLIIDEIDTTLSIDKQRIATDGKPYQLMRTLRHARTIGLIRLTLSGRDGTRDLLEDHENPFVVNAPGPGRRGRIRLMPVEALSKADSEQLLFGPLGDLGYPIADADERASLDDQLEMCNGIPFNIHDLGSVLVDAISDLDSTSIPMQPVSLIQ